MKTKIFIFFDKPLFATGLAAIINNTPTYEVQGMSASLSDVQNIFARTKPRILIIEALWPQFNYHTIETLIQERPPDIKVLLITNIISPALTPIIINNTIEGHINLHNGQKLFLDALDSLNRGETYFDQEFTATLIKLIQQKSKKNHITITEREREVLKLLATGLSNQEIASKLNISEPTVKTHRQNTMKKFGAHNIFMLLRYACRENLICNNDDYCCNCPYLNHSLN